MLSVWASLSSSTILFADTTFYVSAGRCKATRIWQHDVVRLPGQDSAHWHPPVTF